MKTNLNQQGLQITSHGGFEAYVVYLYTKNCELRAKSEEI
jgi:hypothetical protein